MTEQDIIPHGLLWIHKFSRGSRKKKLILIQGCFHSDNYPEIDYSAWTRSCRRAGFQGTINGFFKESLDYESILEEYAHGLGDIMKKCEEKDRTDLTAEIIQKTREQWLDSKSKATAAGEELACMIALLHDPEKIILMGYSLGCRCIKACLEALAEKGIEVSEAHLLGGAIASGESWEKASRAVRGEITSYYSKNDAILQIPYHAVELITGIVPPRDKDRTLTSLPPGLLNFSVGLKGITWPGKKVKNIDVSAFINSHGDFEKNLHHFITF